MLMLVTADNLVQMFFGWEGVGLASYLLIGFWFRKPSASAAAIKAFVVNRVGDLGFMTRHLRHVSGLRHRLDPGDPCGRAARGGQHRSASCGIAADTMTVLCLLLFVGAMGKSAQLGLHTWLPDAMEGPTPVSALIHAATMVTAGVFMVCRLSPMFETSHTALTVVRFVGAATCLFAATVGTGADRHQAGDRLFDLLAARLHVLRRGGRRVRRGDVPPVHPRLLQGAAVPGRGLGDPRDAP